MRTARVNIFKITNEDPERAFGKWKDAVRFVGEIGADSKAAKRMFTTNPDDMGKLLALNIRRMPFDAAVLVSEIKGARGVGIEGRLSTLGKSESEPIFNALECELGTGRVEDRTGR